MTRALVTGGNGFVGMHATSALNHMGYETIIASRSPRDQKGTACVPIDLLEDGSPEKLIQSVKPDVLLHLAWETEHGKFWLSDHNDSWLHSSIQLLRAFLDQGGIRAVFAGTCAEYDWDQLDTDGVADELATPRRSATVYGQAKSAFCEEVGRCIEQGASCAWGRLFLLYGERENPSRFVSSIIRNLLSGREAPMSSGQQIRDFLDTRDAGRAFAAMVQSSETGAYNVASGVGVTLASVANLIGEKTGRPDLIRIGALPDRQGEPPALVANVARLKTELGFKAFHSLDDGLDHAIEYWRQKVTNTVE